MIFGSITYVDAVLVLVLIIAFIIGLIKGFVKQALKIVTFAGTIILAVLFCSAIVSLISPIVDPWLSPIFEKWISNIYDSTQVWTPEAAVGAVTIFLNDAKLSLLAGPLSKFLSKPLIGNNGSFAELVSHQLATYASFAIAFVLLAIVFGIVMHFVSKYIKKFAKLPGVSTVNTILGGVFACFVVYVAILAIFLIVPLIAIVFPSFNDLISNAMEPSKICKWMYETNWLLGLLQSIFS